MLESLIPVDHVFQCHPCLPIVHAKIFKCPSTEVLVFLMILASYCQEIPLLVDLKLFMGQIVLCIGWAFLLTYQTTNPGPFPCGVLDDVVNFAAYLFPFFSLKMKTLNTS